ncbi:MAG: MarR family transcriptional regulator [Crocinitomicaceae bacterium]|nr:MarR family transcriptional regulator [Crocinitomicaceae bacterium]|tara:strand:- start:17298 stop:17750 length:453 start_codon:yes stop_codon:yes gene_type:complete
MDNYEKIAEKVVVNKIRSSWLELYKLYNDQANSRGVTLSMAFVLLTINDTYGTPVTKIAPRMSMEPNSLSRILKSLEKKGAIYKRRDKNDKRKVFICLTDHGLSLRDIASKRLFSFEDAIKTKLSDEDLSTFFKVINVIPDVVDELRRSG